MNYRFLHNVTTTELYDRDLYFYFVFFFNLKNENFWGFSFTFHSFLCWCNKEILTASLKWHLENAVFVVYLLCHCWSCHLMKSQNNWVETILFKYHKVWYLLIKCIFYLLYYSTVFTGIGLSLIGWLNLVSVVFKHYFLKGLI